MKSYLLRWYDDKAYDVYDRASDTRVGYVIAGYTGWRGFLIAKRGAEIAHTCYRDHAAQVVWEKAKQR